MAHARRKFFDLHVANKSQLAEQALQSIGGLYEVERQGRDISDEDRLRIRQEKAAPIIKVLHDWMLAQRDMVGNGQSPRLQPQTLGSADALPRRWVCTHRQQPGGEPDTAMGARTLELVVCRVAAQR